MNIYNSRKLDLYNDIAIGYRNMGVCENYMNADYLNFVTSFEHRRALAQLRLSSHRLEIETGRWKTPATEQKLRFCKHCNNNQVGDENHFLFRCTYLTELRNKYLDFLPTVTDKSYMIDLLQCKNLYKTAKLAIFTFLGFNKMYKNENSDD